MKLTHKEQINFTKNLIRGVESGFWKIERPNPKKSQAKQQNALTSGIGSEKAYRFRMLTLTGTARKVKNDPIN